MKVELKIVLEKDDRSFKMEVFYDGKRISGAEIPVLKIQSETMWNLVNRETRSAVSILMTQALDAAWAQEIEKEKNTP